MIRIRNAAIVALFGIAVAGAARHQGAAPDLILHGGRIITVDATDRVMQAVAITDSKIVAVGSDADVLKLAGAPRRTRALQRQRR